MHSLEVPFIFMRLRDCDVITYFWIVLSYCFECIKERFIIFNYHTNNTGMII